MEKSTGKRKKDKALSEASSNKKKPTIIKATTKNKEQALQDIIGIWADRDEVKRPKPFSRLLVSLNLIEISLFAYVKSSMKHTITTIY